MEDFYTEMEKDILQISSLPADELKHAEERRIQSELDRVKHEAEIQRRREARVHRTPAFGQSVLAAQPIQFERSIQTKILRIYPSYENSWNSP